MNCGFIYYFNPSSAAVAFILNKEGKLLVCKRAKDPQKNTLDLPGGFVDINETAEEAVIREVFEETELTVQKAIYLFSLPNIYIYAGFPVHTLDSFFLCKVENTTSFKALDDVADSFFITLEEIKPNEFGLESIRKGLISFLKQQRHSSTDK